MDPKKAKPLTPGMKMLLEGGGATSFFQQQSIPLAKPEGPKLGENIAPEGTPIPVDGGVAARPIPVLGQAPPQQPAAPPAAPAVRTCPGSVELSDGRILEPDDYIKLSDACEIMPQLIKAFLQKAMGPGSRSGCWRHPGVQGVPTPGMFTGMGPLGPYGQAGAGGGFGGGGGSGARGAQGPAGPAGPAGAAGVGLASDPVVKTDGDFIAAAGAFVPVPGSTLTFTSAEDGPVVILVQAELSAMGGIGGTQNAQFGLRIDGVDYSLGRRLLHTFAGGVGEFLITQSQMFGLNLAAGAHTVDVLLRGLTAADGGMDVPVMVSANPISPLVVMALHR
jgi:hypothetical protein